MISQLWRRFRFSLRSKILVPTLCILALVVSCLSVFSAVTVSNHLYATAEKQVDLQAIRLVQHLQEQEQKDYTQSLQQAVVPNLDIAIYVADADSGEYRRLLSTPAKHPLAKQLQRQDSFTQRAHLQDQDGHPLYAVTTFASPNSPAEVAVRLQQSMQETADMVHSAWLSIAAFALVILALASLWLFHYSGHHQLDRLKQRLQAMNQKMKLGQAEEESHTKGLELQVEERTHKLEQAFQELRSLEQAKDSFLSNLSHEMRTPLTSIMAAEEILCEYADNDPESRAEFLAIIRKESQRLLGLLGQLMDLAKLESQALRLQLEVLDLGGLVDDVAAQSFAHHRNQGVAMSVNKAEQAVYCQCDRERISRVLQILLENSFNVAPQNSTLNVSVEAKEQDAQVLLAFEGDTKELRSRLQGNQWGPLTVGLPIADRLIKIHGGSLQLETQAGNAIFVLRLPLRSKAGKEIQAPEHETEHAYAETPSPLS